MLNILQVSVNASLIVGSSLVQDSKAYEMDTRVSNHESQKVVQVTAGAVRVGPNSGGVAGSKSII